MTDIEAVLQVIQALEDSRLAYMVVGSLSSNAYGIPRSTQDADFVIELAGKAISEITSRISSELHLEPQMSFETVTGTYRYVLKLVNSPFKVELFLLGDDLHDRERFRRRVRGATLERVVWLPAPEDVIITKLRWSKQGKRTKDVDDVRNVIAVQGDALDWNYIHHWCDVHGTRQLLQQIRDSIPEI